MWGYNGLEKNIDLTALRKHGKVYDDSRKAFDFACSFEYFPHFAFLIDLDVKLTRFMFNCICVAHFACLAWSSCEEKLLYVAEKKSTEPSAQGSSASDSAALGEEVKYTFVYFMLYVTIYTSM